MMWNRGLYGNGGCFGFGTFGIWHFLIMGGVALIILAMILGGFRKSKTSTDNEAIYLLNLKYVQGEISEEEYLNRKKVLNRK